MSDIINKGRFAVFKPDFPLDLKNLVRIKTFFSELLTGKNTPQGVMLDLSRVDSIDSVGYKTINNLYSSLQKKDVRFVVFSETPEVVAQFRKISPDIKVAATEAEMNIVTSGKSTGGWIPVELECPVCHNTDLPAQILDRYATKFIWKNSSFLPTLVDPVSSLEIDPYTEGLLMCNDCLLTSFYPEDFIQHQGGGEQQPVYSYEAKNLLIKTTNRRKDMLAKVGVEPEGFKDFVSKKNNLELCYKLCVDCMASTAFDRGLNRFFEIGIAAFLAYHFADENKKDRDLLDKADNGFKDTIRFRIADELTKVWQAHYYRLLIAVLKGQQPVLLNLMDTFRKERNDVETQEILDDFDLWFGQAQRIHKQAINDVAQRYAIK